MKTLLFLDDDKQRTALFREKMEGLDVELTTVETADECIAQLAAHHFDLVLLDHDLGGEIYCDSSREDCGMEVVRWLQKYPRAHGAFMVHSFNAQAASAMFLDLKMLGYTVRQAPFGSGDFFRMVSDFLETEEEHINPPRTLRDKVNGYFRSLRLGR